MAIKITATGRTTFVKKIQLGTPVDTVAATKININDTIGVDTTGKQNGHILIYDQGKDAYTSGPLIGGTGLSVLHDSGEDTLTVLIDSTGVVAGDYGTDSFFPSFTVNEQGQITSISEINLDTKYITEDPSQIFYTDARVMSALDSISTSIRPDTDATYDLGDSNLRFKDLYLSGQTLYLGGIVLQDSDTNFTVRDSAGRNVGMEFGNLFATDSSRISANLSVDSDVLIGGNLYVNDSSRFAGNLSVQDDLVVGGVITSTLTAQDSVTIDGNLTITGTFYGPSTLVIDPSTHDDNTGVVVIAGDLQVDGTTTTINSTTLTIDDKNIVLAQGAANPTAADGAGITIDGANATILYNASQDRINFNKQIGGDGRFLTDLLTYYSTNDLAESDNLYYTRDRFDSALGDSTSRQTIRSYFSAASGLSYDSVAGRVTGNLATTDSIGVAQFDSYQFTVTTGLVTVSLIDGGSF